MSDKWDIRFIELAREYSKWSKDPSSQIGAVAVNPVHKNILSHGYNGFPRGILDLKERLEDRPTKYMFVVHAEMNCIYNATLTGTSLNESHLYVWGLPVCSECAKGVIQVGIKKVFWSTDKQPSDKWLESYDQTCLMLNEAGVEMVRI